MGKKWLVTGIVISGMVHAFVIDNIPKRVFTTNMQELQQKQYCIKEFFVPGALALKASAEIVTDPLALQQVAIDTLVYIEAAERFRPELVSPPVFDKEIISLDKVKNTLRYIVDIIEQDKKTGTQRILDTNFIKDHFDVVKWRSDIVSAKKHKKNLISPEKILLTHYMTFHCEGSPSKTMQHPFALYQLIGGSKPFHFTKQQILQGVFASPEYVNKVRPLAWVSRSSLESLLLQGLGIVVMPNGESKIFSVHEHNGLDYNKKIKNAEDQQRYWYFREKKQVAMNDALQKYKERTGILLAGDIYNIGIGKLVLLHYQNIKTRGWEVRLGIIGDTGAAFHNNLYQLDSFTGVVSSLKQKIDHMLDPVESYLLVKNDA